MANCPRNYSVYLLVIQILYQMHSVHGIVHGPPRLLPQAQTIEVAKFGQEFRLSCPVESHPSPIVDWSKDGEDITPAWTRFTFKRISRVLRIRSVQIEDAGVYRCKGVNGFGSQMARIRVIVVVKTVESETRGDRAQDNKRSDLSPLSTAPQLTRETLEQSASPIHLIAGNSIQIQCEARGIPSPRITWLKNGIPIGDKLARLSNWKLTLMKIEFEDAGNYECIAKNALGSANVTIRVQIGEGVEKRRPELASNFPANVTSISGSGAVLECIVQSGFTSFPPHIKWLKRVSSQDFQAIKVNRYNSPRLLPADNMHVLVIQETHEDKIRILEVPGNGTFVSKLVISKVDPEDEGTYICLATNSQGYTFKEANLSVIEGSERQNSVTHLPLPIITLVLSIAFGLMLIGSAQMLRKYHERTQKQQKQAMSRLKVVSAVTLTSHEREIWEQSQLLVSTTAPSTSSTPSSDNQPGSRHFHSHHHHHHHTPVPAKYAVSRCSCSTSPLPNSNSVKLTKFPLSAQDTCQGSTQHSLQFGHWT